MMLQQMQGESETPFSPDFIAMDWQVLAELEGQSLDGEPIPQAYFLLTNANDPAASEVQDDIDDINEVMLQKGIPSQFFNVVEFLDQFSRIFFTFQVIMSLASVLIALVGALGLLTTLSMSVFERQKEIGVMRSIGAGSTTVALQFLTEGLVVGALSWLLGIPLSLLIQWLLLVATDFIDIFPVSFSPESAVIGLAGIMIFAVIASLWPSLSAARKTVSDILRYQ
jgi:putative ABC transport system permease protein